MKSKLLKEERVSNDERIFGSAQYYYPCRVKTDDGEELIAFFTEDQLKIAIARAGKNPEDVEKTKSFLTKFFDDIEEKFDDLFKGEEDD